MRRLSLAVGTPLALFLSAGAVADVFPTTAHVANVTTPFGDDATHHQVFAGTLFSTATGGQRALITSVALAPSANGAYSAGLAVRLGYTAAIPGQSTASGGLAAPTAGGGGAPNASGPMTSFFMAPGYSATFSGAANTNFQFRFDGEPFVYDPALGNLLVEFVVAGPTGSGSVSRAAGGAQSSRAFFTTTGTVSTSQALRMDFTFSAHDPANSGACCAADGTCQTLTIAACTAAGGTYRGDNLACASANCPQPGACCAPDGTCALALPLACASGGGAYAGAGVTCAGANCPQPGACCATDGTCTFVVQPQCAGSGVFQGAGITCAAANCTGACCMIDGTCSPMSQTACTALGAGHVFSGIGTVCAGVSCNPAGACCASSGCSLVVQAACTSLGAVWNGGGTTCATVTCPTFLSTALTNVAVTGAGTGEFFDLTTTAGSYLSVNRIDYFPNAAAGNPVVADVWTREGTYTGFDGSSAGWTHLGTFNTVSNGNVTASTPVALSLPAPLFIGAGGTRAFYVIGTTGAIRFRGSATNVSNADLAMASERIRSAPFAGTVTTPRGFAGVVYYGLVAGTASGACCAADGTCSIATLSACVGAGGLFRGENSSCASADCPGPGACCFADGTCTFVAQQADCTAQNGVWAGVTVTCAAANCPQPGACCYPNGYCAIALPSACPGTFAGPGVTCAAAACPAGVPMVVIAAAAQSAITACQFQDVRSKLVASGAFSAVDIINCNAGTPTLAELQPYNAVLAYSNLVWANSAAMGNVLADYVDGGGGVVITVFANAGANLRLGGRWLPDYEVIIGGSGQTQGTAGGGAQSLGTVHVPAHPLMNGVATFNGGTQSFRPATTNLMAGATRIADWTDGRALVVAGASARRVDLGFWPASADCVAGFWDPATDGATLLTNALLFVSAPPPAACYANCDESTQAPVLNVADFGCFLTRYAAGEAYANCDESTQAPVLNVADFGCFLTKYAAACP